MNMDRAIFETNASVEATSLYILLCALMDSGQPPTIENAIEKSSGKSQPINVDGALAALLCEMDFPSPLANAFFIMARVPGLVAHVYEEQTRMKPMRQINSRDHEYDGMPERELP